MRTAFINTLLEAAKQDERIMLVVGDLGFGVTASFANELPGQYVNAGIAEQNMIGLAVGLALSGKIVFTYSIANFPTIRCLEQIRNDVCYHNANVKIVSIGGGLSYGSLGMSHHAVEDLAIMRILPHMTVIAPGDPVETALATQAAIKHPGPVYLRLGRANEPVVHQKTFNFQIGRAIPVCTGKDATLIVTGGLLQEAVLAAQVLKTNGIEVGVISMPTLKPLDVEAVLAVSQRTDRIFTLEEHSILGGLGGAVAEILLESGIRLKCFKRLGLKDAYTTVAGEQTYLKEVHGLDSQSIARVIEAVVKQGEK
ncbi:MAG: transketolase [Anaerolineae bacterium]|nr:MAG: transketolase [Anaerolineae bacterium]